MSRSLFWKIMVPAGLLVLLGMGALGIYLAVTMRNTEISNLEAQLTDEARLTANLSLSGFTGGSDLDAIAKSVGNEIGTRITLIARDGTVLGDTLENPATLENHRNRPEVAAALSGEIGQAVRYSTTLRENMMYVAVPVTSNGQVVGVARTALPLTTVNRLVNSIVLTIIVAIGIAAIFVILATAFFSRMITTPVRQITAAAEEITSGEFGRQITVKTRDEIGRLGTAFNKMTGNLQKSIDQISDERNKLQTVLANMTDGVALVDAEGKIVLVNPTTETLFGAPEKEMIDRPLIEAVKDHEIDAVLKRCLAEHQVTSAQMETGIPKRFIRAIAVPLGEDKSSGALVLFQDLTELRTLQTMRRELVGNISHELRTPLAGIKIMVETLKDGAAGRPDGRRGLSAADRGRGRPPDANGIRDYRAITDRDRQGHP